MTWEKFWSIIDRIRAKADMQDEASVKQFLYTELINLPQDELLGFDCAWQSYRNKANFPKMVAAACIINDGSSDDRFTDFRNWLIMQGYDAYRQALIDRITSRRSTFRSEILSGWDAGMWRGMPTRGSSCTPILKRKKLPPSYSESIRQTYRAYKTRSRNRTPRCKALQIPCNKEQKASRPRPHDNTKKVTTKNIWKE